MLLIKKTKKRQRHKTEWGTRPSGDPSIEANTYLGSFIMIMVQPDG
jgi:hypothetical protein